MRILDLLDPDADFVAPLRARAADPDPLTAARGRMLLELVERLVARGPAPRAFGHWMPDGALSLSPARTCAQVLVQVWIDAPDRGPVVDGLPAMHYRLQTRRPGPGLSRDDRVATPDEVEEVLRDVFGWR